jgi:hypothetical protein
MGTTRVWLAAAALALGGCATSYQLTLMPRDSGKLYHGSAEDTGSSEGTVMITIEARTYTGTWVQATPSRSYGYATGGFGWGSGRGRHGGWGVGTTITMDNPEGGSATALLQSPDGAGLRCEFRGGGYGHGGGLCRDDKGREYDVQLRPKPKT